MFGRNCCWVPHPFPTADPWLRKVGHPLRPERKLLYTIFKVVFFASILQVFVHHSNINSVYYIIYVCIHIGIIYTYTYNQSSSFNFNIDYIYHISSHSLAISWGPIPFRIFRSSHGHGQLQGHLAPRPAGCHDGNHDVHGPQLEQNPGIHGTPNSSDTGKSVKYREITPSCSAGICRTTTQSPQDGPQNWMPTARPAKEVATEKVCARVNPRCL